MRDFFVLKNKSGDIICSDNGFISISDPENASKYNDILCFFSNEHKGKVFVCSKNNKNIKIKNDVFSGSFFIFGWGVSETKTANTIYRLLNRDFLSFPPIGTTADIGDLKVDSHLNNARISSQPLDWEEIFIEKYNDDIPKECELYYDLFSSKDSKCKGLDLFKKILSIPSSDETLLSIMNSVYPLLSSSDLDEISSLLFYDNHLSVKFFQKFHKDFWVKESIFSVVSWQKTRFSEKGNQEGGKIIADITFDRLQFLFEKNTFESLTHALSFYVRRRIVPRKRTCIVTTVRNEGVYLLEWIAWHRILGFDHIFIYYNDNDDYSDELLELLSETGFVTIIKNDMSYGTRPQAKVCVHAFSILTDILDYEWAMVIDADEFVALNKDEFNNINEYIQWVEKKETDAIAINWKYMASDDDISFVDNFVTDRKTFIDYNVIGLANNIVKSFSKPNKAMSFTAHNAINPDRSGLIYRTANSVLHRYSHNPSGYSDNPMWADTCHHQMIFIMHYHYKSSIEFLIRLHRGDVLDINYKNKDYIFDEQLIHTFNAQFEKFGEKANDVYFVDRNEIKDFISKLMSSQRISDCVNTVKNKTLKRCHDIFSIMDSNKDNLNNECKKLYESVKKNYTK